MTTLINMTQTSRPVAEANAMAVELNKNGVYLSAQGEYLSADEFTFVAVDCGNGRARIDVYSNGEWDTDGTW
jgi:hypothetical protein